MKSKVRKVILLAGNGDLRRLSNFLKLRWLLSEELAHGAAAGGWGVVSFQCTVLHSLPKLPHGVWIKELACMYA